MRYHSKNMEEVKKEEKKGLLGKLKEHAEDKEEQLAFLSTVVRLAVLTWSAGILTLNYVEIPGYVQEQKIDPTFIASVFTGTLATFGVQAGKSSKMKDEGSTGGGTVQTIKIEQMPLKIVPATPPTK